MNRVDKVALQLEAVEILSILKESRTYDELASITGLPPNDLNRYINGHVLPSVDRAERVISDLGESVLIDEVNARIRIDDDGYVDNTSVVFSQPLLDRLAPVIDQRFEFERPDAVLTAATDGITLASAMARYYDVKCIYAKQRKETAVREFIEGRDRLESGIELAYYLPSDALAKSESVLVVDDLIRSGETQAILLDIVDAVGASVTGVFTLIAAGESGLDRARERTDAPVERLIDL